MTKEQKLLATLARLDMALQKTLSTRGYGKDSRNLKIIEEIIKEQLGHAHTRRHTRSNR